MASTESQAPGLEPEIPPLEPGVVLDIKYKAPKSVRCKTQLDEALSRMQSYSKVYLFERPCTRCRKAGHVCVTSGKKSLKCKRCRVSKVKCDVELIETIEYRWLDMEGTLHRDSEFEHSTVASDTCDPDEISLLAPEEVVQVSKWVKSTNAVESLASTSPQDFGEEVPLTREAVSRIVQDDIRSERYRPKVKFWQKKLEDSLLDIPTLESTKRAIATMISSDEADEQPQRKIKLRLNRPARRVEDDSPSPSVSPPKSRTSRILKPRRSRTGSTIVNPSAHPTPSVRNSSSLPPPLFIPGSGESGFSPENTTPPPTNPSTNPSKNPSTIPATIPTMIPATNPATNLSKIPSTNPSSIPATNPAANPATNLSKISLTNPSNIPATNPSNIPAMNPSKIPATIPATSQSSYLSSSLPNPVLAQTLAQLLSRTSESPLVQPDSLLENDKRNNEQMNSGLLQDKRSYHKTCQSPDDDERLYEERGQGRNEDKRPDEQGNKDEGYPGEALSMDSTFLQDKRSYPRSAQSPSSESDTSSVEWRDVEPTPKQPNFDGKIIAKEVRKQAKLLEKFIEKQTAEIASLIPQGQNFDSFKAIRQNIRTQLKKTKESLGVAVTPLEGS
ncbi:hypothetical protein DFH28DRAFT_1119471 [Melampsora americana]|nr:hypothetical protein DFH28DRAFT_1119471 [Melampsora americana]